MRTLVKIIFMLGSAISAIGQHGNNQFRLECFTPIMTPSMAGYFNDDWILMPYEVDGYTSSRKYTSIGFAGSYARNFKNFKAGCRLGFVTRKVRENQNYNYASNNITAAYYNYDQKHVMGSLFIAREERIKFISVQLGLEVPFIHYGTGRSETALDIQDFESGKLHAEFHSYRTMTTGSGYATGLGGNIALGCQLGKGMNVGMEVSEYILQSKFSKPTVSESHYDEHFTDPESRKHIDQKWTQNIGYSQLGFSRVAFRVFYAVWF